MLQIHSNLKELLAILNGPQHPATTASYQPAYLRFRGLVVEATEQDDIYQQWSQQYVVDVNDESGEVVKLLESVEDLWSDIKAFIHLVEKAGNPL